jgi:hypothetical protein
VPAPQLVVRRLTDHSDVGLEVGAEVSGPEPTDLLQHDPDDVDVPRRSNPDVSERRP